MASPVQEFAVTVYQVPSGIRYLHTSGGLQPRGWKRLLSMIVR